jgi:hypothetical protein
MKILEILGVANLVLCFSNVAVAQGVSHQEYSKYFPFHAEFAAMTQIKPIGKKPGGPGGHAFLYIHGLCKDYSVPYPKVIPCSEARFPKGLEHAGVGISVNNDFVNANWVAVPGHELFFRGEHPGERLDQNDVDRSVQRALDYRVFEGVKVQPELVSNEVTGALYESKVARGSVGTDYSTHYGRELWSVRFKMDESAIRPMSDFLNQVNAPYVAGEREYRWSGIYDNCAALSANVLAVACLRKSLPVRQIFLKHLFNLALPRNGLSTLQLLVHHAGRTDLQELINPTLSPVSFEAIRSQPQLWSLLQQGKTLPVGLGALSVHYPTLLGDPLYADDLKVVRIPHKKLGANRMSDEALQEKATTDLKSNAVRSMLELEKSLKHSKVQPQTPERLLYQAWAQGELSKSREVIEDLMWGDSASRVCSDLWASTTVLK